ncbi:hypothetical protein FRC12_013625 [Ceratobasidium sp. 428]|nr:hypothetical protein FRC12_013625 [Ceratobasidium sp. 428]
MLPAQITDAFARLEAAQTQLVLAVATFHDACTTLYHAATKLENDYTYRGSLDQKLVQTVDHLNSFATMEAQLHQSVAALRRTRNMSRDLIPINKLPAEILSRVFDHANSRMDCADTDGRRHHLDSSVVIPSVCVSWRQQALNMSWWWAHIDLFEGNNSSTLNRSVLWSQRARDVPVDLHFKSYRFFEDQELAPAMKGILTRAGSLTFLPCSSESYFQDVFNHYITCGLSGRLKSITVGQIIQDGGLSDHFSWSGFVPKTLTTLKLTHTSDIITPSLDELMRLLSRTPNLRTLVLRSVCMTSSQHNRYQEINLPDLEYFESYSYSSTRPAHLEVAKHLLRNIVPGARELEAWVDMGNPDDRDHDSALRAFFSRSRITRLHTGYFKAGDETRLAQYLDYLPELRLLSLDFNNEQTDDILEALVVPTEEQEYRARCPKLQTLRLSEASIIPRSQDQLKRIVEKHELTKLILGDRAYFVDEDGTYSYNTELLEWISTRVPEVQSDSVSWFDLGV